VTYFESMFYVSSIISLCMSSNWKWQFQD